MKAHHKLLLVTVVFLWLVGVPGCTRDTDTTGLPQTRFIEVMVALRTASQDRDTTAFAARKEQILTDAGVTEAELRAYVKAHERNLAHMAAVWESINVRLASPPEGM